MKTRREFLKIILITLAAPLVGARFIKRRSIGQICDVRIYDRALSASEIQQARAFSLREGLVGWWQPT